MGYFSKIALKLELISFFSSLKLSICNRFQVNNFFFLYWFQVGFRVDLKQNIWEGLPDRTEFYNIFLFTLFLKKHIIKWSEKNV